MVMTERSNSPAKLSFRLPAENKIGAISAKSNANSEVDFGSVVNCSSFVEVSAPVIAPKLPRCNDARCRRSELLLLIFRKYIDVVTLLW